MATLESCCDGFLHIGMNAWKGDFKSSLWDSEKIARKLMVILTRSILSTTFRSRPA
jgi:hypothetical protein